MADFSDNFDEASAMLLKNHTPDVGTGWSWVGTNDDGWDVEGSSAGTIFGNLFSGGSQGVGYNAISPELSSADQQVWFERDISTNAPNFLVAVRMVDENNLFGARHAGTGASGRRLSRVTGGTNTDLIMSTGGIANEWLKVKAEGTTISLWQAPAGAEPADPESDTNWTQIGLDQTGQTDHQTETQCGIATRANHANRVRSFRASAIGGGGTSDATGTAAGTSATSGDGSSIAASTGTAAGTSTATGDASFAPSNSTGAASGSSTASGVGSSVASASGSAAGSSTAAGFVEGTQSSVGTANGTSTASGVGRGVTTAAGTASGSSSATGLGALVGAAIGVANGTSISTAASVALASATGTATGTSTALGRSPVTEAGFIVVQSAHISVAKASATISTARATGHITA